MTDYAVVNPATGETEATFDTFTDAQIEDAIARAASAVVTWAATAPAERAAVIRRIAELHRERSDAFSAIIVREMGKPIAAAEGEVDFAADIIEFYASNTGSRSWEEDILGRDILPSGTSVVINIDDGSGYCKYDFLAVFEDGDEVVSADNNVCELSDFNFTD